MRLPWRIRRRLDAVRTLARLERQLRRGAVRPDMLVRGFLSCRAYLYPFDTAHPSLFLTDLEIEGRLAGLNGETARRTFADKRAFHAAARTGALPARVPELAGVVEDGRFRGDGGDGPFILKPCNGSGGRGVRRIASLSGIADDEPGAEAVLVERAVSPHPYASVIYPHALNTVRILTGRAPGARAPVLLGLVHRFGTDRSAPTDNFKAGGLAAGVDPSTHRLTAAIRLPDRPARELFAAHPDTGAAIDGVKVPHLDAAAAMALACAAAVPGLVYAGWDIAIAPDGPVLVEGNAELANPNIVQMHGPILSRPEALAFFADAGVLSSRRRRDIERRLPRSPAAIGLAKRC